MARVVLRNLTKRFAGAAEAAVEALTLEARHGEFVVLVGPSGCGKSTTLRLIAGLEDPTEGEVWIDERPVNALAPKDRDVAMIFQNYALYPHMTVYQNLAFGLRMRKFPRAEIDGRVRATAETLGLTSLLNRKPRALSGGERQRVAVGRAIVREPAVFLFDEPLSNLDARLRLSVRGEIKALHRRLGATMIYVTHDQVEAMTLGDRIAVMNRGRLRQFDAPEVVYREPRNLFVASFIGSPPMNFVRGKVQPLGDGLAVVAEGVGLPIGPALAARLAAQRLEEIVIGLRPEDLTVGDGEGPRPPVRLLGQVEDRELLGAETILTLAVGPLRLRARTPGQTAPAVDQAVSVGYDPERLHGFDPATEERLN